MNTIGSENCKKGSTVSLVPRQLTNSLLLGGRRVEKVTGNSEADNAEWLS